MQVESVTMLLADSAAHLRGQPGWEAVDTLVARVVESSAPGVVKLQAGGRSYEARPGFTLKPGSEVRVRVYRRGNATRLDIEMPGATPRENVIANAARRMLSLQQPGGRLAADISSLLERPDLPPALRGALEQVIRLTATPRTLRNPRELVARLRQSGLWLEARLARAAREKSPAPLAAGGDYKAALLRLDAALKSVAEKHAAPQSPENPAPPPETAGAARDASPAAPPLAHRLPAAGRHAPAPLRQLLLPALVRHLQHHTRAALARVDMHQLASIHSEGAAPFWSLEIPVVRRDGAETIGLSVEPEHDGGGGGAARACTVTIAMEPPGLGPVWARLTRHGDGQLGAVFYAVDGRGRERLESALPRLRDQLQRRGLNPGTLACRAGAPPAPDEPARRHFLDVQA